MFPAARAETSTPHTFRVEGCAERSKSRTYACERVCERRPQRRDNLPQKTTTRKTLMCLHLCMSSLPTLCSYWFTSLTAVHITFALYNVLPNRNDVQINKHFKFHISLSWFLFPVRSIYVIQNLMVQLPVLEMFTVKKLGVSFTYTRVMLLRCTCKCRSCLSHCSHMTDFRKGGHCRK